MKTGNGLINTNGERIYEVIWNGWSINANSVFKELFPNWRSYPLSQRKEETDRWSFESRPGRKWWWLEMKRKEYDTSRPAGRGLNAHRSSARANEFRAALSRHRSSATKRGIWCLVESSRASRTRPDLMAMNGVACMVIDRSRCGASMKEWLTYLDQIHICPCIHACTLLH